MVDANEAGSPVGDQVTRFEFQPGWIDLTLEHRIQAEAVGLAGAVMGRFNRLERTVDDRALLNDLVERALFLNSDSPDLAAAYYTPGGVGLADLRVDSFGAEDDPRTSPAEVVPLLLDWSNAKVVGEPDIRYLDLDAGPAVRVQAMLKSKRMLGFGAKLAELVRYAVFPPGVSHMVVVTVTWQSMAASDELVRLTDELVSTMRQVSVDSEGNELGRSD
ncbi:MULTISPECIES: hypothetical protein [unclassified Streptomyces]|uniref:hypothetical protein n=1 Tax=unclassified Streptomyces TaxID=2593676 RepID=UPI001661C1E1|nr:MULTISPECIES: hypothetical protein [unclassified Streptomyces]MBD0843085.1 hypothetical protein [Streptomyces sp. TRM68416]